MKLGQLTGSLIAASAILTSTLPAHAGPFDSASGIFTPATTTPAAATGNATSANSTPNRSNSPVGNGEIQGLGDHQSWVDSKVLAKDPRALCSDVGLGNNTSTNSSEIALANSNSTRSSSSQTHNDGGGGGGSFFGVSVSGNGRSQGSKNNSSSSDRSTNSTEKNSSSSSTVVKGRNCDAFVNSAAARDMNYQDNLTKRYEVKNRERGNRVHTLLENK